MTQKKKIIIISVIAAAFIIIGLATFAFWGIQHYISNNTWATVSVTGTAQSDTADSFEVEQECRKGDTLSFSDVRLRITDIRHDGTVTFSVRQGTLLDEKGASVSSGKLVKNKKRITILQTAASILLSQATGTVNNRSQPKYKKENRNEHQMDKRTISYALICADMGNAYTRVRNTIPYPRDNDVV